ncbi:hypothetical protein LRS10_12715 [Phenylobacterium sp. J426]|uniref:hypothetical protein n=1 Tax=Phenylobacterium sp. J426 TaxID=2898439 RepID=UPI0021510104|nr:hypothetical protein [Phenylobacterium sp. J426]MCR5874962.1 hypothetical protein [Phenylobacterium sp. J426]
MAKYVAVIALATFFFYCMPIFRHLSYNPDAARTTWLVGAVLFVPAMVLQALIAAVRFFAIGGKVAEMVGGKVKIYGVTTVALNLGSVREVDCNDRGTLRITSNIGKTRTAYIPWAPAAARQVAESLLLSSRETV